MKSTVLITGASRGFGECLSLVFAQNGFDLVIHGRDKDRLENLKNKIESYSVKCNVVIGDLKEDKTLKEIFNVSKKANVTILINNAAVICPGLPIEKLSFEQIEEMINTNLTALIKLTKLIYELFLEKKSGTIININSFAALEPKKYRTIYSASKWGLRGFSESLKLESKDNGIRVLRVYITKMMTDKSDTFGMDPNEVARKVYKSYIENNIDELKVDGRPPEFRPKNGS